MVLVAAVALGSATFAWFVNNNRVEATGVDLGTTTSVPNLYIEKAGTTTSTANAVADTAAVKGQKLYPVSTVDGNAFFETLSWTSGTEDSGHALANSYQEAQTVGDDEVAKYAEYTFTLGVQNGSMDIYFDASRTSIKDANGIGSAGRWAISVDEGKNWILFKADSGTATGGYVTDANTTDLTENSYGVNTDKTLQNISYKTVDNYAADFNEQTAAVTPKQSATKLTTITSSANSEKGEITVRVRFWLEGCDKDCVSEIVGKGMNSGAISGQLGFVGVQTPEKSA